MLLEEYPKPYGICAAMHNKEKHYYFVHYLSMQIFALQRRIWSFLFLPFLHNMILMNSHINILPILSFIDNRIART